ncbi:hypothetical protein [Phenylobacterium sp.]|uniref:hypothetical protein n=1 Tax=Phenylobacterium sp. TaxID=1871053 RepID=UPI0035ADA3D3
MTDAAKQPEGRVARVWHALIDAAPIKIWAQIGAGVALTLVFVGFGLVIWLGPWAPERQAQQLQWLGWGMVSAAFLILVALTAITGLSVNVRGGRDGLVASIDQDEATPLAVRTVTETTIEPAQAPERSLEDPA